MQNFAFDIKLVEFLRRIHAITRNYARLVIFCRGAHDVGELRQRLDQLVLDVARLHDAARNLRARLAQHGRRARAGILHVHACFAVEIERFIVRKNNVFDFIVAQRAEDHRAHAHFFRDLALLFERGILFRNDRVRLFLALCDDVLEPNDFAFTRRHGAVLERYHAVSDVNKVLRPFFAHKLEHLENLFEMQILLIGDDVQAFLEIVRLFTVERRGKIARGVE